MRLKIVIGLGNPEDQYLETRHNIGFRVLDGILKKRAGWESFSDETMRLWKRRAGDVPILVKPTTFMNRSGRCAKAVMGKFGVDLPDLLVVCDEVQLNIGQIRFGSAGSSGGHNGLQSIMDELGGGDFSRLRLGIRSERDVGTGALTPFVLSCFDPLDTGGVQRMVETAAEAVLFWFENDLQAAMNRYNGMRVER